MNMRLAPARLPASSGLGCDLAARSDRGCMAMRGAAVGRGRDRGGQGQGPRWAGAAVPGHGRSAPPGARGGTGGSGGSAGLGPGLAGLGGHRAVRRRAGAGTGTGAGRCCQALCQNLWSRGKLEDRSVC